MELIRSPKGHHSLRVTAPDGSARLLHSMYGPEEEATALVDAFDAGGTRFVVVLGLGLGFHVAELCRRYPTAELVVVEGKAEIRDLCGKHGKAAQFTDKVHLIGGASPRDAVSEISRLHLAAGLPPLAVFPFPPEVAAFPEYYGPIRGALDRTVSLRLWDRLRYPKFRGESLTVALFDFGYFLTEEIARAARALGHSVVRVPGEKGENLGDMLGRAIETIAAHRPDFFLTVNHLGFDEDGVLAELFRSIEMPTAIWYVDSPNVVVKAFPKNATPHSAVFLWDEGYLGELLSLGFEHVSYLPLAADETVFRRRSLSPAENRKLGTAVGFVGDSMVVPARDHIRKVPVELHDAVERAARRLQGTRGGPIAVSVVESMEPAEREAFATLTEKGKSDLEAAVLCRSTLLYRLSCLRELEEFNPCIRGDEGWKGLVNGNFRVAPRLNYYRELPLFYNACRVNFNATSVQMGKAVNQRVFDVPACGAFLLTDHQEAIGALFEVGKEVVTYRERGEIADLARYYLREDDARKALAERGRRRVLSEHTYRHRIGGIVRFMRTVYG